MSLKAEITSKNGVVTANIQAQLLGGTRFVPLRLNLFQNTSGFRQGGSTYIDDGSKSYKMSLVDIKEMNTKIVFADKLEVVDFDKLTNGDFIYLK